MKGNNAITLIALIITIILLLILAIVTIAAVDGYGIIDKAKEAKASYTNAQAEEQSEITRHEEIMNEYTNNLTEDGTTEEDGEEATAQTDAQSEETQSDDTTTVE